MADVAEIALSVPHPLPEQLEPDTFHVTPLFVESFTTVAEKVVDWDSVNPEEDGVTATLICACGAGFGRNNENNRGACDDAECAGAPAGKALELKSKPAVSNGTAKA